MAQICYQNGLIFDQESNATGLKLARSIFHDPMHVLVKTRISEISVIFFKFNKYIAPRCPKTLFLVYATKTGPFLYQICWIWRISQKTTEQNQVFWNIGNLLQTRQILYGNGPVVYLNISLKGAHNNACFPSPLTHPTPPLIGLIR